MVAKSKPGRSPQFLGPYFNKLADRMARLAKAEKSVLVLGPSGVGKELLLRRYREHSPAKSQTTLNCASFPGELLDSELFGHKQGAFTGALKDRKGLVETYDSIALDELGEGSEAFQARLLRVMEYGDYRRVGDPEERTAEAQTFIGATNDPWSIRYDLAWRFDARLFVPALKYRRRDLVELLYDRLAAVGAEKITARCVRFLVEDHDWAGNAREVRFFVDSMAENSCEYPGGTPWDIVMLPVMPSDARLHESWRKAWQVDGKFVERAIKKFRLSEGGKPQTDAFGLNQFLSRATRELKPQEFRTRVVESLDALACAATGGDLERAILEAATPKDAAVLAQRHWYEAQLGAGKTRRQIAAKLELTEQAVGQQLKKLGLR